MSDELDDPIRLMLARAIATSPSALPWDEVVMRATTPHDASEHRRRARLLVAASFLLVAAAATVLLWRGESRQPAPADTPVTTRPASPSATSTSTASPSSLPTAVDSVVPDVVSRLPSPSSINPNVRPLAELGADDVIVLVGNLDGFDYQPMILDEFGTRTRISSESVGLSFSIDTLAGEPVSGGVEVAAAEVVWTFDESNSVSPNANASIGGHRVTVSAFGATLAEVEEFVALLRVGTAQDYPSVVYDIDVGGVEVARSVDEVRRLEIDQRGDWRCWTIRTGADETEGSCTTDQPDDEGVLLLSSGGLGIPSNYSESDAPIVTSLVVFAGIAPADAIAVAIEFSNGEVVEVPTDDRSDHPTESYYVGTAAFDGFLFGGDGPINEVRPVFG